MLQPLEEARRRPRQPVVPVADGRVPPHNLEAEESLLGAMLLSRDAIALALERCKPADFYKPSHGQIFAAITSLYGRGETADAVTVAEELRRAGTLEEIGGTAMLGSLQPNTPAISNAGRDARIVAENSLLRLLISVAQEIPEIGYGLPDDVTDAVDRAGAMVFDVAQRRSSDSIMLLHDLLSRSLDRLEELHHLAYHDPLTGLPNRALLLDRADHMLARSRRERTPSAAFFLDLDDFKDINDTLGHKAGDGVLVHVGRRITASVREGDTVGRLGGDEFVVLVAEESLAGGVESVANRILEVVRAPIAIPESEDPIKITASIGIATGDRLSAEDLLSDADIALYHAKLAGKRQFVIFEPEMETAVRKCRSLELDLRRAIAAEEFFLLYRPSLKLTTGEMSGLEATLHWRHPTKGLLEPSQFVGELEASGLIVPVGRWVLETACHQAAEWHRHGCRFTISVAVSPKQLERPTFLDDVGSILARTAVTPGLVMLEIPKAALLSDDVAMIRQLDALKDRGVRLAAVDPGYASVTCLRRWTP